MKTKIPIRPEWVSQVPTMLALLMQQTDDGDPADMAAAAFDLLEAAEEEFEERYG